MLDKIIFGNETSEREHGFCGKLTAAVEGERGQSARVALPTEPVSHFSGEYVFTARVDPCLQNYITVKMWSGDEYTPLFMYLDGKQVGYCSNGDYEALSKGYGAFMPHGFFTSTQLIPVKYTAGKTQLRITLRHVETWGVLAKVKGRLFSACVHTETDNTQKNENPKPMPKALPFKEYSGEELEDIKDRYIEAQRNVFGSFWARLKNGEKLSITKYQEHFRHCCMMLCEAYCPAASAEEKGDVILGLLNCIDSYVKDYYGDIRSLARTSHQSDWGGYYGELGQGLYILEPLINDETVFGRKRFDEYLDAPFNCSAREGEFSINAEGLTRRKAWERCLKANFDFASARQSYIYNQTYYTYEGAWKAMAGLGVIGSPLYIGKEKCDLIMLEALGMAPWKGEHILTDRGGRELDLYHCLFNHDRNAVFTRDFIQVVCRGIAVQKLDENGEFVRRKPYGEKYVPLTTECMTRENGYVGNYGETANYLPEWVYRVWNHGDRELSDRIMKTALHNLHSRSFMRYSSVDGDGNRVMHMEQYIDERNPTMNGKWAYGPIISGNRGFLFASLEQHMAENQERYMDADWERYKEYAAEAVGFVQQQRFDGRLDEVIESVGDSYFDFRFDRTLYWIMGGRKAVFGKEAAGKAVPHTDFSMYTEDEIRRLDVNPEDYKEFAWVDIDNMTLSLRDGDVEIFAQLNERNRGYGAVGRAHVIEQGFTRLVQLATDGLYEYGGRFIRQQNVNMDYIFDDDILGELKSVPQALCGEEQTITYIKGIGEVLRENYEVDTPYSGYPDVIWANLGRYMFIINTTRESYENAKSFTVRVESEENVYDLVSKSFIEVKDKAVNIPPMTAYVLRLGKEKRLLPFRVNAVNALGGDGSVLISWKPTPGAENYNIYRDGQLIATVKGCVYEDKNGGGEYKIAAVNSLGEGNLSCGCKASPFEGMPHGPIGDCVGSAETVGDTIVIEAKGSGFGKGDDYHAQERRKIRDSVYFAAKPLGGSFAVSGRISGAGGLMLRESFEDDSRYFYAGLDESGGIRICTRSKNTIYRAAGKISPIEYSMENSGPYIKLLRDDDLQSVAVYVSSDARQWRIVLRDILPFPHILYAGAVSAGRAEICGMEIKPESLDEPFPIREISVRAACGKCVVSIKKGYDNQLLELYRSADGENYALIAVMASQTYEDTACGQGEVWYKAAAVNRHGVRSGFTEAVKVCVSAAGELSRQWKPASIGECGGEAKYNAAVECIELTTAPGTKKRLYAEEDSEFFCAADCRGDGELTAKMERPFPSPSPWSKAGLQIRENMTAKSKQFSVISIDTGNKGVYAVYRSEDGGAAMQIQLCPFPKPYLLVRRKKDRFFAGWSEDGVSWTVEHIADIAMGEAVLIGPFSADEAADAQTAEFKDVKLISGGGDRGGDSVMMDNEKINVIFYRGKERLSFEAAPVKFTGRLSVDCEKLFHGLGCQCTVEGGKVRAQKKHTVLEASVGEGNIIPLMAAAEHFGADVRWHGADGAVTVDVPQVW